MIFKQQIRLVLIFPIISTCLIIIILTFAPWYSHTYQQTTRLENYLLNEKQITFIQFSLASGYIVQQSFQSLAIKQSALLSLQYKSWYGTILLNPLYVNLNFNSVDQLDQEKFNEIQQSVPNLSLYSTSWYNPNTSTLLDLGQTQSIKEIFDFNFDSFLSRALLRTTYTDIMKDQIYGVLQSDGSTTMIPTLFLNTTLAPTQSSLMDESDQDCSQGQQNRNYPFEFRCLFSYQYTKNQTNDSIVLSLPYLGFNQSTGEDYVSYDICARAIDFENNDEFIGVICTSYHPNTLIAILNSTNSLSFVSYEMTTYLVLTGSRVPVLYSSTIKNLTNIENLIFQGENYITEEYQNFIDETQFLDEFYPSTYEDCNTYSSLQNNKSFVTYVDQQEILFIARNLTICVLSAEYYQQASQPPSPTQQQSRRNLQNTDQMYKAQVVGTIISELPLLQSQIETYEIGNQISKVSSYIITGTILVVIAIATILNFYSKEIALQLVKPIDEIVQAMKNINEENIDKVFIEILDGEKKEQTPAEMYQMVRTMYDFVGMLKSLKQANQQGNPQAIIQYAVAEQFYMQNSNYWGVGAIQNNMGIIHMTNEKYPESILQFRQSIYCIEKEWNNYKDKYMIHGIFELELQIDQEYQQITSVVFNRCFNLSECIINYLSTETFELDKYLRNDNQSNLKPKIQKKYSYDEVLDFERIKNFYLQQKKAAAYVMSINRNTQVFKKQKRISSRLINKSVTTLNSQIQDTFYPNVPEITLPDQFDPNIDQNHRSQSQQQFEPIDRKILPIFNDIVSEVSQIYSSLEIFRQRFGYKTEQIEQMMSIQTEEIIYQREMKEKLRLLWRDSNEILIYCYFIMNVHMQTIIQRKRKLYLLIRIMLGLIYQDEFSQMEALLEPIEEILNELLYEQRQQISDNEEFQFPLSIIQQKYCLYMGIYYQRTGQYRKAVDWLQQSILVEGLYSGYDRIKTFSILKQILGDQNIDSTMIDQQLSLYQPRVYDIIVMVDIGRTMGINRNMIKGIQMLNQLLTHINGVNDRIGYYLFDSDYSEVFPLMPKVQNQVFIQEMFKLVPKQKQPNHQSNLPDAVRFGLSKIQQNQYANIVEINNQIYLKEQKQVSLLYKRYIIILSDEIEYVENENDLQFKIDGDMENAVSQLQENHVDLLAINFQETVKRFNRLPKNVQVFSEMFQSDIYELFDNLEVETLEFNFYSEQTI